MSRGASLTLGAIALLAALVAYKLGELGGAANARDAITTASSETMLRGSKAYRARITHLLTQNDSLRAHATQLRTALRAARSTTTTIVATVSDTGLRRQLDTAIAGERRACQALVENCEARAQNTERRAFLADARRDSVESQLGQQILVGTCKVNLLVTRVGCPSRTTLFLVGVGTGGAGALLLSR